LSDEEHQLNPSGPSPVPTQQPITLERRQQALAAISYAILKDGPIYGPVLTRLEQEIAALRAEGDVVARARKYLDALKPPQPSTALEAPKQSPEGTSP
jgi:hypothetical protein